jgi:hypothetical protein
VADADDVRRLALSLPHVVEIDSDGFDFRVGDKGSSGPIRSAGRASPASFEATSRCCSSVTRPRNRALLLGEPGLFFTTPGYDGLPLVMLRLAEVDVERLTELVTDAWRMRAPSELVGDLDDEQ